MEVSFNSLFSSFDFSFFFGDFLLVREFSLHA